MLLSGILLEGRGQYQEALNATINAVLLEPNFVPSKILMASLIQKMDSKALPAARSMLSDALGLVHKHDGRLSDAADCFQAAYMLEESDPIQSFSTIF